MLMTPSVNLDILLERYEAVFLDAYGVLVTRGGALPGAQALLDRLNEHGRPWFILTNDASHLPESSAERMTNLGLPVGPEHVITAGSLLAEHFRAYGLDGARCRVLGPTDGHVQVARAGGRLVEPGTPFDVLVIADETGCEPFLDTVDATLSQLLRQLDAGRPVHLVCPNPDLIYPTGDGQVGITSGSLAALFETVLHQRYPGRPDLRFYRLGKPHPEMFQGAVSRAGTRNAVMIGDQLATDIAGASAYGLDSLLVGGGISNGVVPEDGPRPTYTAESVAALMRDMDLTG
jgi:HAD superfamily hydrolase (TIGR01450 family)